MTSPKRILIVDDDPMNVELAADLLEVAGYVILTAGSAEDGLALAEATPPDLVLMDIALPCMHGVEAMKRLAQNPRTAHIPVIAFTASALGFDTAALLRAGFRAVITKPIDTRRFAAIITEHIPPPLPSAGNTAPPIDPG